MNVTGLNVGQIYVPKFKTLLPIWLKVGAGGDCGIYISQPDKGELLLFRALVNAASIKKDWKLSGESQLDSSDINYFCFYSERDIGTNKYFKVTLADVENRIPISAEEYKNLPRLLSYSTLNLLNKISKDYDLKVVE